MEKYLECLLGKEEKKQILLNYTTEEYSSINIEKG